MYPHPAEFPPGYAKKKTYPVGVPPVYAFSPPGTGWSYHGTHTTALLISEKAVIVALPAWTFSCEHVRIDTQKLHHAAVSACQ